MNNPLQIKVDVHNAKVTYSYFCTAFPEGSDPVSNWETLKQRAKSKYKAVWFYDVEEDRKSLEVFSKIEVAQNFLHGGGLPFPCKRMFINDFSLSHPFININDDNLILSYYEDMNVFQFALNLEVHDVSLETLVYMRQVFCANAVFSIEQTDNVNLRIAHSGNSGSGTWAAVTADSTFHDDGKAYVSVEGMFNAVMDVLGLNKTDVQSSFLSELNDIGNYSTVDEIEQFEGKAIYGLISGDEGWMFIPDELVKERLDNKWGTRDFVRVYSFGSGSVLINLDSSARHDEYIKRQDAFGGAFYGGINPYFLLNCNVAGVAHGVMFSIETVMVIKTITNRIYIQQEEFNASQDRKFSHHLHKSREYRQKLISTLRLVENMGISEMGELENMMLKSQSIEPIIERLKYLLELIESELNLLYSENTNRLVNLLTVVGLILTLVGTIISIIGILPM